MSFADLGVSKNVVRALSQRGIDQPFPVQQMVIRDALAGHDLLVQSPTGSGKTLAFGVPLVDSVDPGAKHLSALVLAACAAGTPEADHAVGDRSHGSQEQHRRVDTTGAQIGNE